MDFERKLSRCHRQLEDVLHRELTALLRRSHLGSREQNVADLAAVDLLQHLPCILIPNPLVDSRSVFDSLWVHVVEEIREDSLLLFIAEGQVANGEIDSGHNSVIELLKAIGG